MFEIWLFWPSLYWNGPFVIKQTCLLHLQEKSNHTRNTPLNSKIIFKQKQSTEILKYKLCLTTHFMPNIT